MIEKIAEFLSKDVVPHTDDTELLHYYFAYGSNMNIPQMNERCGVGSFEILGVAILENYKLTFTRHSRQWGWWSS